MKEVVYSINVSHRPYFAAASTLMTEILTTSRLTYKPDLIKMKSVCPMPQNFGNFKNSFEEIAKKRAEQLWQQLKKDSNVNIFWSGGIDSTAVLVSMLTTRPENHTITIFCNLNSICENSFLYMKLLGLTYIKFQNSSIIPNDTGLTMLTGELGDQIFGSDLLFRITRMYGFDSIYSSYEEVIPQLFSNRCGEHYGRLLYDRYRPIVEEAPFKIKTAFDFIWWWNFTQKWQCVKFRNQGLVDQVHKLVHFFEDEDFQKWSLSNHHLKIGKTVESYKMPAKELIYSYDKNEFYLKNKKKYGSPFGNKRYFLALFEDGSRLQTWQECNELIDQLSLVKD